MSCQKCGHEAEKVNGEKIQPHNFGCSRSLAAQNLREHARNLVTPDFAGPTCDQDGCNEPKKPWSGKGAKPKYCAAGHK